MVASNRNTKLVLFTLLGGLAARGQALPNLFPFPNAAGYTETSNAGGGPIDLTGLFFQSLGTNGRSCSSCHRPAQGWTISAAEVKARFEATQGLDPIFRTNDGSVCDHNIDTSSVGGRRQAFKLLVDKGLIRIALDVPAGAEFDVVSVVNPYGCGNPATLSVYRRPLPATNLRFLSAVMWDGRESSVQTGTLPVDGPAALAVDLKHQAFDAINGHAQASTPLKPQQQEDIANFETALHTAQAIDHKAGLLNADGAQGGPLALASVLFSIGINDVLSPNFTPVIFTLYNAWTNQPQEAHRSSIARGQALFNSKPIQIRGVAGLNDDLQMQLIPGTCGTCHDTPNVGNHSLSAPLDIGVGSVGSPLNVSYLPVITLQRKGTREIKVTTDPGRALISGLWKDVGRMKGPVLRGLAARAPYFHNGSADTLEDVLNFYDRRFNVGFTPQEKRDLMAFLNTL